MPAELKHQMVELLPRLRRFALSLVGTQDEADDLVQSACERALSRLDQFEPGTRLDSWMYRIIQSTWIDRHRRARRRPEVQDAEAMTAVGFDARIHELSEARDELGIIRSEMASMPDEQRVILSLVVIEGLSYQATAETLDIPIGTVMSRLSRARRRLADAVASKARIIDSGPGTRT